MTAPNPTTRYTGRVLSTKWIRAYFNGRVIVDSRRAMLLRADGHPPIYYFPLDDVRTDCLVPSTDAARGDGRSWDIEVGTRYAKRAAREVGGEEAGDLRLPDYVTFDWSAMDAWFEEREEVYVHPRDPKVRIDALDSERHVKVVVLGHTVAETRSPVLLFETGLRTRYYIPKPDVRLDMLESSPHTTRCPYKGEANYYSVGVDGRTADNIAWSYRYPTPEAAKIASHVCFYDERVDAIYVDGERQQGGGAT